MFNRSRSFITATVGASSLFPRFALARNSSSMAGDGVRMILAWPVPAIGCASKNSSPPLTFKTTFESTSRSNDPTRHVNAPK
jgi:hypothetical protein